MTCKNNRSSSSSSAAASYKSEMISLLNEPTIDIADRLNAMIELESKPHYQCRDYLSSIAQSPSSSSSSSSRSSSSNNKTKEAVVITASSRTKIVKWLYDCVDYLELSRECVAVAMSLVDRVMSIDTSFSSTSSRRHLKTIERAKYDAMIYQLISISSLFIAAKSFDKTSLVDANTLVKVSHGSYTTDEILDMEVLILEMLDWKVSGVTSWSVGCYGIALLSKTLSRHHSGSNSRHSSRRSVEENIKVHNRRIESVLDFTRLQIELSITDYTTSVKLHTSSSPSYDITQHGASTVAIAAILNSMELLDFSNSEQKMYARILFEMIDVDVYSHDIEDMREELQYVFDVHSDSVLGSKKEKVNRRPSSSSSSRRTSSSRRSSSSVDHLHDDEKRKSKKTNGKDGKSKKKKNISIHSISSSKSPIGAECDVSKIINTDDKKKKSSTTKGHHSSSSRRNHEESSRSLSTRRHEDFSSSSRRKIVMRRVPLEP